MPVTTADDAVVDAPVPVTAVAGPTPLAAVSLPDVELKRIAELSAVMPYSAGMKLSLMARMAACQTNSSVSFESRSGAS